MNFIVLETPHVLVGAAIATKVLNPYLAIPISLASHFIVDLVPHWNPHLYKETEKYGKPTSKSTFLVVLDATIALVAGSLIAFKYYPNTTVLLTILLSSFVSVLPDVIEGPYFFLGMKSKIIKRWIDWHRSIQVEAKFIPGLSIQIITIIATLWWINL